MIVIINEWEMNCVAFKELLSDPTWTWWGLIIKVDRLNPIDDQNKDHLQQKLYWNCFNLASNKPHMNKGNIFKFLLHSTLIDLVDCEAMFVTYYVK